MPRDPADRLRDAVDACERIACYIEGLDFHGFQVDSKTSDAVIRQFEIIGEAVKALPNDLTDREPSVPWQQIAGFRDVLAHSYFAVDDSIVWDAAANKAPQFLAACRRLLGEQ
jgi:uncharacterized protein with HEPN domain